MTAVVVHLRAPRFPETWCSQCGGSFGPGDHGFSHCRNHRRPTPRAVLRRPEFNAPAWCERCDGINGNHAPTCAKFNKE